MYDDDFYNDLSDFNGMIDKFKIHLVESVKKQYAEEMERLCNENRALVALRNTWQTKIKEMDNKIQEANKAIADAKRMRLEELLADFPTSAYIIKHDSVEKPKCNRCNSDRRIEFFSPMGNKYIERCKCDIPKLIFRVEEIALIELNQCEPDGRMLARYFVQDWGSRSKVMFKKEFNDDGSFEKIEHYTATFRNKARAEEYVAWLQKREDKEERNLNYHESIN